MAGGDLVDDLIHQFSDPFAFYRELIQNAIDAGSPTIRVVVRFEGGGPRGVASGIAMASVEDAGCGMDREIIEKFLLTLFRSSKEGDLTKIGKFGIGFVSVFAPAPQLVVVETGKEGESWRVILHPDRTYDLYRGEAPRTGTKVTLHKEMDAGEFRAFVRSSREAVGRWCRHSEEAEVTFAAGGDDGAPPRPPENVRQPFTIDSPVSVEWSKGDTRVVAGPARTEPAWCGFYNRGLTLYETPESPVKGVTFKVMSPLLEHTLTRDNVRRDKGFDKVMGWIEKLADGELAKKVKEALPAAAERADRDYLALLAFGRARLPEKDLWYPLASGGAVDGRRLAKAYGREGRLLLGGPADAALSAAVARAGLLVLAPAGIGVAAAECKAEPEAVGDTFVAAEVGERTPDEVALAAAVLSLARKAGARVKECVVAGVLGDKRDEPSVLVDDLARAEWSGRAHGSAWEKKSPRILCLNRAHPAVAAAIRLMGRAPGLAAVLVTRLVAAGDGALGEKADTLITESGLA